MIATFLKAAAVYLACLVVGDVAGVVACTIFDVAPIRGNSAALPYAIWFVLGVFAGFIALFGAGSWITGKGETWSDRPEGARLATPIFLSALAVSLAIAGFFWWLYWSRGVEGEYYVPDSGPHTITYLVSALGAMWIGRLALTPSPKA
ncbi:MAG TPA: hypothetical protein VMG08_02720 [Allosphingosinicella sp.]|nr:hypothetical protein [Allosphingosinicella sp.]